MDMDKRLLDGLNNLSIALGDIAQSLADKSEASSATAKALQGGNFITEIKEINEGVKSLQKDTKEILANQQTIMKMAESKGKDSKTSDVESLGKDKTSQKNFKEGIGVILLIAVAVLALGAAFHLIGKVDFLSVITLSIALPLLAIGFSKVHKMLKEVGFDPKKDAKNFIIAITAISFALTASSWILSMITPLSFSKFFTVTYIALAFAMLAPSIMKFMMAFKGMSWSQLIKSVVGFVVILPAIALGIAFASWAFQLIKPISFIQFLTAVAIGLVFAVVAFGIRKLLKSFKGIGVKDLMEAVIFLPLILPAIALGIAGASYAFQLIKPIGFVQFLTAVGIAVVFAVISFGIRKLLKSFNGLSPASLIVASLMMPIVLVAVSYAIAYSSVALGKIKPISFVQFLTAVGVAAVFVVISYGIAKIVNGIRRMKYSDLPKIPVLFVLVAIAITASSHILSMIKVIPAATLLNMVLYGIALAIVAAAVGGVMALFSKLDLGIKDALIGGLLIVIIATAIMISSHILSLGNYKDYPDWKWALGVGLSLIAFTPAIVLLGVVAMTGIGALAVLAGAGMILVVAGTIAASSHILGMGNYGNYPPLAWSASVALSMGAFAAGMVVLGTLVVGTLGLGGLALKAGSEAVLGVAQTIVDASFILDKGKYTGGPTLGWAGGIALALGAFAPVYAMLMANNILSLFGAGGIGPDDFSEAITTVSRGIVDAAGFFANNKSAFVDGPPKTWAEGVGLAIGAFAPVYQVLAANSGWLSSGVSVEDMSKAIMTISQGIVDAAYFFAENTSPFKEGNYPSKNWGEGVGAALGAFAPVFQALHEDTGWFTSGDDVVNNMTKAINAISMALVFSAISFSGVKEDVWKSYPTAKWSGGVKSAINSFIGVYKSLSDNDLDPEDLGLVGRYAKQMSNTAFILGKSKKYFDIQIDIKKMSKNIMDYQGLVKSMSYNKGSSSKTEEILGLDPISRVAKGMVKIANAYDTLAKAVKNFSGAINGLNVGKLQEFRVLTGNLALLSAMDSTMFSSMLKVLESRGGVFAKMLQVQKSEIDKRPVVKTTNTSVAQAEKEDKSYLKDAKGETQLQKLDKIYLAMMTLAKEAKGINDFLHTPKGENKDLGSKGDA